MDPDITQWGGEEEVVYQPKADEISREYSSDECLEGTWRMM